MNMHSRFQSCDIGGRERLVGALLGNSHFPGIWTRLQGPEEPIYDFPFFKTYQIHSSTVPQWGQPCRKSFWFFCLVCQGLPAQMYFRSAVRRTGAMVFLERFIAEIDRLTCLPAYILSLLQAIVRLARSTRQ